MHPVRAQKLLGTRPLKGVPILSEVFSGTVADAAVAGFVLAHLPRTQAPVLWVQDRLSGKETGRPYLSVPDAVQPAIMVNVSRPADVLWAMEEGLRCKALGAVIGEIWGAPKALSFTATKRLALRAEAAGLPCWLIRHAASPDLSAARDRWQIGSLPAAAHQHDAQAPGLPRWSAELFRSRRTKPGKWVATYDRTAHRIDMVPPLRDGAVAALDGGARHRAAG